MLFRSPGGTASAGDAPTPTPTPTPTPAPTPAPPAPAPAPSGFAKTPVYSKNGLAAVVFTGTIEQLRTAAALAKADFVYAYDEQGKLYMFIPGLPDWINPGFFAKFGNGFPRPTFLVLYTPSFAVFDQEDVIGSP